MREWEAEGVAATPHLVKTSLRPPSDQQSFRNDFIYVVISRRYAAA